MSVAITGPVSLAPSGVGAFTITTNYTSATAYVTGIDVASSDAAGLTTADASAQLVGNEITHKSPAKTLASNTVAYTFSFTMPAAATAGSAHTLYGVSAVSFQGWNHASNFVVIVPPNSPSSASTSAITASSMTVNWTGGAAPYRLVYKTGSYPTNPTDGTTVDTSSTSASVSSLSASTAYFFKVFGKSSVNGGSGAGTPVFSATAAQTTASTTAPATTSWYVNASTGSDANLGTSSGAAFKTIKKGMLMAASGDTINVAAGTYNTSLGETFPITVKSGVQLLGTSGALLTIVDATGANARVFNCFSNTAQTRIEGFTITGGLVIQPADGGNANGGGIYTTSDATVITRNIIKGNESRGYSGTLGTSFTSGGQAYGGGIYANGTNVVTNNVIANNIVRGGNGGSALGVPGPAAGAGDGHGGGAWIFNGVTFANNTVNANQAIGGNGGASTVSGGGGAGGNALYSALDGGNSSAFNNIITNNVSVAGSGGSGTPAGTNGTAFGAVSTSNTLDHNLYFNNTPNDGVTGGTGNLYGSNPKFASGTDFHLQITSPAKGAGTAAGAPTITLDGVTRPNPPSMGAYETGGHFRKDFNADGYGDMVWRNSATGASAVWLMNGSVPGNGSGPTNIQFSNNSYSMVGVGDCNGDGKADLIWRNTTTGDTIMWQMNGTDAISGSGSFATVPPPWQIVGIGDFNGDGKSDLLWRNTTTGDNSIWLLNGINVLPGSGVINSVADLNWTVAGVADFNGDGRSDILWRNDSTGTSSMWMMNGGTILPDSGATYLQIGTAWRARAVGDFNGDGYGDVMWRNINTGDNIIWLQNGLNTIAGSGLMPTVSDLNWNPVASADVNGDGRDDLVWRNDTNGDTSVWMLNGTVVGAGSGYLGSTPAPWQIVGPR